MGPRAAREIRRRSQFWLEFWQLAVYGWHMFVR
jgi:hypothetical protein